ncbi:MAG: hypothetical protein ACRCUS_05395 [Anaerovoracaceae bacterium]
MKKILVITFLIMSIALMASCSPKEKEPVTDDGRVEVVNVAQIEEELAIRLVMPADVSNERCTIIDDTIGEVVFNYLGKDYTYRVEKQDNEEAKDLSEYSSGNLAFDQVLTELIDEKVYYLNINKNHEGVSYWYDKKDKLACTVFTATEATEAKMKKVTESIIKVQ